MIKFAVRSGRSLTSFVFTELIDHVLYPKAGKAKPSETSLSWKPAKCWSYATRISYQWRIQQIFTVGAAFFGKKDMPFSFIT